jgi:hypothetical protein
MSETRTIPDSPGDALYSVEVSPSPAAHASQPRRRLRGPRPSDTRTPILPRNQTPHVHAACCVGVPPQPRVSVPSAAPSTDSVRGRPCHNARPCPSSRPRHVLRRRRLRPCSWRSWNPCTSPAVSFPDGPPAAPGSDPCVSGPSSRPSVPARADPHAPPRDRPRPTDPPPFDRGRQASDPGPSRVPGPHTMLALSTECLEGEGH